MKKIGAVALTALLASSAWTTYSVQAKEGSVQLVNEEVKDATNFMKTNGVITNIEARKDTLMVTIENEAGIISVLQINEKSLLVHSKTTENFSENQLKIGMTVEAYFDKNKPMILIYPAQYTPELIVVNDEEQASSVKVNKFDTDFLSLDKELKLNISEDTVLVNQQGKKIDVADLKNKELVVFYTVTTRSIPAQTTPSKIIAMDELKDDSQKEEMADVWKIIDNDHYMKDGVKMIPLRKVAEVLGYHVVSQGDINGALVIKDNRSFTITRGEKMYGLNKSLQQFSVAPELIGGNKTYVSEDFLDMLLGDQ